MAPAEDGQRGHTAGTLVHREFGAQPCTMTMPIGPLAFYVTKAPGILNPSIPPVRRFTLRILPASIVNFRVYREQIRLQEISHGKTFRNRSLGVKLAFGLPHGIFLPHPNGLLTEICSR